MRVAPRADAVPPAAPLAAPPPAAAASYSAIDRGVVGRQPHAASGDPAERLPPPARSKLRRLRAAEEDLGAAYLAAHDRRQPLLDRKRVAVINREAANDGGIAHGRRLEPEARRIEFAQHELDVVVNEIAGLDERLARLAARRSRLPAAIDAYLRSLPASLPLELHAAEAPPPKVKGGLSGAIDDVRTQIATLRADLHAARSAPFPSSTIKQAMRDQVEALAVRGCPNVLPAIEIGREVIFPHRLERIGQGAIDLPDSLAFATWLHKDQIIAKLDAEIEAMASDDVALTDLERAAKERDLLAQILAAERFDEQLCEMVEAESGEARRRDDSDPRAVLGLASSLPPARQ